MRSSNSPDPAPEAQGPSAGAPPLLHITLNTGRTTEHRDAELDPGLYALLQPLLREWGGAVPAMPGFAVAWAYCGDAVLIQIAYRAVPVAECGLAWGPQRASSLWEFLNAAASPKPRSARASGNGSAPSMPRWPWMAEVLLPAIAKRPVREGNGHHQVCRGNARGHPGRRAGQALDQGARPLRERTSREPGMGGVKGRIHMHNPLRCGEKPVRLIHLKFNCLRARRYSVAPPVWLVAVMSSLLSRGQGEMPGNPEILLYVARERDCAQFFVAVRGHELLTGGVAWGSRGRRGLYAFLVGCYEQGKGSSFPDDQ
ncbi:MAG TPA: hypothetical protein VN829_21970 [Dongiaceae bacterium]|nr:hypothetical protein [Dongiaceae bacterium]